MVKFSNEPGSELHVVWKRAAWVQETCLLILITLLLAASTSFHKGLRKCFAKDYEHLFDIPYKIKNDNNVSGLSPTHIPAAGW